MLQQSCAKDRGANGCSNLSLLCHSVELIENSVVDVTALVANSFVTDMHLVNI